MNEKFLTPTCTNTAKKVQDQDEDTYSKVANDLAFELSNTLKASERTASKLLERRHKVKEKTEEGKCLKRKLERSQYNLKKAKEECVKKKKVESAAYTQVRKLKNDMEKLSERSKKFKQQRTVLQAKVVKLNQVVNQNQKQVVSMKNEISSLKKQIEELSCEIASKSSLVEKVSALEVDNTYLKDLLDDSSVLELYDHSSEKYKTETLHCVMNLTTMGVASRNVGPVIKEVCKLCGKQPDRVPSKSSVERFSDAKIIVSQKQISEVLVDQSDTSLMTDETSKYGKKYGTYIISDKDKNSYFLGLREMSDKSAKTTLGTFKEILSDIDDVCNKIYEKEHGPMHVGYQILSNIRDTMSDRASTEKCFNELLEEYRKSILPDVISGWDSLSDEEKEQCAKMNNFFCSLHLLVGMADTCSETLNKFNELNVDDTEDEGSDKDEDGSIQSKGNGAIDLCRLASKALSRGGDEKSGCYADWKSYVTDRNDKVRFVKFRGNRFNIVFFAAQTLYYHKENIEDFLEKVHGTTNKLLRIILKLVKKKANVAACRVMGLLSKLLTSSFWRFVEDCNHVLDLNSCYLKMHEFLKEASQDASNLLNGHSPFDENYIEKDAVYDKLVASKEDDTLELEIAQSLCQALVLLLERMVKDHLPGGSIYQPDETLHKQSASVIPHNKLPEFIFGVLDRYMHMRPSASTLANEAMIMYSFNKTSHWLDSLTEDKRCDILTEARTAGREIRKKFQLRNASIAEKRRQALYQKQKELEEKEARLLKKRESLTTKIIYYGLWQSVEDVDIRICEIDTIKEKREALETQLNFRKNVLKQKCKDSSVFNFSSKGPDGKYRKHSLQTLTDNVKKLVKDALQQPTTEQKRNGKPLLVGKTVEHKFKDDKFIGNVISVVPGYSDWYNIKYQDDDAIYTYKLLEDYKDGCLKIITIS